MIYGNEIFGEKDIKYPNFTAILQSENIYTYVLNNPVNYYDKTGADAEAIFYGGLSVAGTAAVLDGPLPFGDAIGVGVVIGTTVVVGGVNIYNSLNKYFSEQKATAITNAIAAVSENTENPTIIYRRGSDSAANLTPKEKDMLDGLSYTTVMPTKGNFTITTIEAINSSGMLIAVNDRDNHVAVRPIDPQKMQEWINSRPNASKNPHKYTKYLQSISYRV